MMQTFPKALIVIGTLLMLGILAAFTIGWLIVMFSPVM